MKFNRKNKAIFALALSACMAGMSLSASLPFLSASAQEIETNCEVKTVECGNEGAKCPAEYTYTVKGSEDFSALPTPTCEGWDFAGWYTQPVTYYFWGQRAWDNDKDLQKCIIPPVKWKDAIEFEGKEANESEKYKNRFWTFLTLSAEDSKSCDENCKVDESKKGKLVTEESFSSLKKEKSADTTLYARFTPQTVMIKWTVDFEGSVTGFENGCRVEFGHGMGRSFRQYGSPLGDLWSQNDIGPRAKGRTLTGWYVSTQDKLVNEDNDPTWSKKPLEKELGLNHLQEKKKDGENRYEWEVEVKAAFENEKIVPEEPQQELKSVPSTNNAEASKSEPEKHVHKGELKFTEATCEHDGVKPHFECECGEWFEDQSCTKEVEKDSLTVPSHHNMQKTTGKEATCTKDGYKECYYCGTCGKFYADAEGTQEIADPNIPATGHHYGENHTCECGAQEDGYVPEVEASETPSEPNSEPAEVPQETTPAPKSEVKQEPKKETQKEEPKPQEAPKQEEVKEEEPEAEEPEAEEEPKVEEEPEVEEPVEEEPEVEDEAHEPLNEEDLPAKVPEVGNASKTDAAPAEAEEAEEEPEEDESSRDEAKAGDTARAESNLDSAMNDQTMLPEQASADSSASAASHTVAIAIGTTVGALTVCGAAATVFIKRRKM